MKKIFLVLLFLIISTLVACTNNIDRGPTVQLIDVIGMKYEDALMEIQGAYPVIKEDIKTNQYLPNTVIGYKNYGPTDNAYIQEPIYLLVATYPDNAHIQPKNSLVDYGYKIGYITGPNSPSFEILTECGLGGTDLGFQIDLPNNEYLMVYGDTFSSVGSFGGMWWSNSMTVSNDHVWWDGLEMDRVVTLPGVSMLAPFAQGKHSQDLPDSESSDMTREVTKIPTGGIRIGEYVYIFYMSIREWSKWSVTYNQCVKAHVSDLSNWQNVESLKWWQDEAYNHGEIYPIYDPVTEYYYFFSTPGGRSGGVVLSRVLPQHFETRDEYEYYVDSVWIKGDSGLLALKNNLSSTKSAYIIPPGISNGVAEMSAFYNNYLGKWIITYKRGGSFFLANATTPMGPWDTSLSLSGFGGYAGLGSNILQEFGGKKMYFIFSEWLPVYQSSIWEIVLK